MVKFIVIHRKDQNNVGDMASNPLQYFLREEQYQVIDIAELGRDAYPSGIPIIVGGGGLIANETMSHALDKIFVESDRLQLETLWEQRWSLGNPDNKDLHKNFTEEYRSLIKKYIDKIPKSKSKKFLWGAGHNASVKKDKSGKVSGIEYPSSMVNYDLIGIRDYGTDYNWVPCASCMHPALRKSYAIKNDIIWFEHKKQLIKDFGNESIPRFVNSGSNIEQTIELLGSANIILTNSYHGAYWGTLLKKKVILVDSWSSKFFLFKHKPYFIDRATDFRSIIDQVQIHSEALDECINANNIYWQRIKDQV